jgi:hypothetical protein
MEPVSQAAGPLPRRQRWVPASGQVIAAVATLAAVVTVVLVVHGTRAAAPGPRVVGETEMVRVTAPSGKSVEELALFDTGASSSSIDEDLAEDLGIDPDEAPTVKVRSSLGVEERPVVGVVIQVAGNTIPTRVNVADRDELSTLVLIGREDMTGYQVSVGRSHLTRPDEVVAPSTAEVMFLETPALPPTTLLAMLPLCALLIVLLRLWVGVSTLGTFGPVLLGIGYVQSGVVVGLTLTVSLFLLGLLIQMGLRRSFVPRVARLGILIAVVSTVLAHLQSSASSAGELASWGAAIPVVVTATVIESLWATWDEHGAGVAAVQAIVTLCVSVLIAAVLLTPSIRHLAETAPVNFAIACLLWTWVAACYKGLRLNELLRFAPAARRASEGLAT